MLAVFQTAEIKDVCRVLIDFLIGLPFLQPVGLSVCSEQDHAAGYDNAKMPECIIVISDRSA